MKKRRTLLKADQRIWELDALRGLCILGMVWVHLIYDLVELYRILPWDYSGGFLILKEWGGVLFLLISGISATLGSRSVRRGLIVFGCGLLVTAATGLAITFGVLHCLGICMVLWHFLKKLPTPAMAILAAALIPAGLWLNRLRVDTPYLFWLGLVRADFSSADYFPLLPHLGFFLLGAVLGRTVYRSKRTLLPKADTHHPIIRFLTLCGRNSLLIYLLHQPVLMLLIALLFN